MTAWSNWLFQSPHSGHIDISKAMTGTKGAAFGFDGIAARAAKV